MDVAAVGVLVVDVCAVLGAMVSLGEVSAAALAVVVVVVVVDVVGAALEAAAGVGDWSLLPLLVGSGAVDDVAADCMVASCTRVCVCGYVGGEEVRLDGVVWCGPRGCRQIYGEGVLDTVVATIVRLLAQVAVAQSRVVCVV